VSAERASARGAPPTRHHRIEALAWFVVAAAIVSGALFGEAGVLLFWSGVGGAILVTMRLLVVTVRRKLRTAGAVIDNAPGRRDDS
jgi:hypothetical protein